MSGGSAGVVALVPLCACLWAEDWGSVGSQVVLVVLVVLVVRVRVRARVWGLGWVSGWWVVG